MNEQEVRTANVELLVEREDHGKDVVGERLGVAVNGVEGVRRPGSGD